MHELGIVIHIVEQIEDYAKDNDIKQIQRLVLDIGEFSGVVPRYIESVYPVAIEDTLLQDTELKINVIPGKAHCQDCHIIFHLNENKTCPRCQSDKYKLVSGHEFNIKEIVVY
jgi:hydrogenase nickel incorporation protein HypA/HybF